MALKGEASIKTIFLKVKLGQIYVIKKKMLVGYFSPKKNFTRKFHSLQNFSEGATG